MRRIAAQHNSLSSPASELEQVEGFMERQLSLRDSFGSSVGNSTTPDTNRFSVGTLPFESTVDDLQLLQTRSKSSGDLRLLYRDWRTGKSKGAEFPSKDKENEQTTLDLEGKPSSPQQYGLKIPSGLAQALANEQGGSMFTIGSPEDLSGLPRIPERSTTPATLTPLEEKELHSQFLSAILDQPIKQRVLSSSFDKNYIVSPDQSSGGMTKSISCNGLSQMEMEGFFPSVPAVGVQRGLKDSVMNDMCRAVVKQMVGDVYVVSSITRRKKIVNHLYDPLLEVVQSHFKRLPARYALSVNPDDVPKHIRLLAKQERSPTGVALHAQWDKNEDGSENRQVCQVVIVACDQDNLLDAITRSLTTLQGKILDADVMTTTTGVALDRFQVRGNFVDEDRIEALRKQIEQSLGNAQVAKNAIGQGHLPTPTFAERLGVDKMIDRHDVGAEWKIPLSEITLMAPIGSGRSGQTYAAQWRSAKVAAKVINLTQHGANSTLSDEILTEFYREVVLVSRLRHPNVVLFLGAAISPPTYCLVFEFMENGTLSDMIRRKKGQLDFFRIAREVALGMNYLHLCSIIHRDLKSSNILLDTHGTAKVSDFGLSCVFELGSDLTAETGTYRWMAPEVIRHEPYSNKADVYSFGIVLWEMIAKEQPFRGMTPIQAAFAVARQQMRPALPNYTPTKVGELVEHCWNQDPIQRPSFEDIIEVLPMVRASMRRREFSQLGFLQ